MNKKPTKFIDTSILMTKKNYAKKRNLRLSYITRLIKNRQVRIRKIEELGLELIYESSLKGKMIKIDLNKYTLPHIYAKEKGIPAQNVYNWIKRNEIKFITYPELNDLVIVERNSEKVKQKKSKTKE